MKLPAFEYFQGLASGSYSVLALGDGGSAVTSGQGTTDAVTGQRVAGSIEDQTVQVIANGRDALSKGGLTLGDVGFVSIFHTKPTDKEKILQVLANSLGKFGHEFIDASQLPGGQEVEIEFYTRSFIDLLESRVLRRESFTVDEADPVEAVRVIMRRISERLDMKDIVQARITLPKGMLGKLSEVNAVYAGFFSDRYPVRSSSAGFGHATSVEVTYPERGLGVRSYGS